MENNASALKKQLKKLQDQLSVIENQAKAKEREIRDVEIALQVINNEQFWKDNPKYAPLKLGDKLVINKQFQDMKLRQIGYVPCQGYFKGSWALGKIVKVYSLDLAKKEALIESDGVTSCDFEVVLSMRDDYLERERNE